MFLAALLPCLAVAGGQLPDVLKRGKANFERSDYNAALVCYLDFIQTEEKRVPKDTANLLGSYYSIGGIYTMYQDYAQALEVYKKGYDMSVEAGNAEWQFKFLNNMIGANCSTGNVGEAQRLNAKVKVLDGVDRGTLVYYYNFNNGFIAGCRGDHSEKARWMNAAIADVERYKLPQKMLVFPYSELYQCYEQQGKLNLALDALLKYDSLAHAVNSTRGRTGGDGYLGQAYLLADCYKGLMRIYTKLGNKEKALHYQNEFFRVNDSLFNVNEFSKIRNRHLNYENRQTQLVIASQQKTILYQKICLVMLIVLVATAIVAALIIRRQRKALHDTNVALFDRNNQLVEAECATPATAAMALDGHAQAATVAVNERLLGDISEAMGNADNFCNPEFSLSMLAQIVESNTNYVSQAINTAYGKNFRSYLNEYRIREAMKRMKDNATYGNYSIQGISESVGFKSASNFIAAFKKMTGMTPSLYQKLSKNE